MRPIFSSFKRTLQENYPEVLKADGLDDAIIGAVEGAGRPTVICYDYEKCVELLVKQAMTEEDAPEWMCINTMDAYVGEHTPYFLRDWRKATPTSTCIKP